MQFVSPVTGTWAAKSSSPFGAFRSPTRSHAGNDLQARNGSPAVAAVGGRVVYAGHNQGYQYNAVVIDADGNAYRYATHGPLAVKVGDVVEAGQKIGTIARGHLHFEVIPAGSPVAKKMAASPGQFVSTRYGKGAKPVTVDPAQFFGVKKGSVLAAGLPVGSVGAQSLVPPEPIPNVGQAAAAEMAAGIPARTLRKGMTGSDVGELQSQLASAGLNPGPADTIFGRKTQRAVRDFEKGSRGFLDVDRGIAGPQVQGALADVGRAGDINSALALTPGGPGPGIVPPESPLNVAMGQIPATMPWDAGGPMGAPPFAASSQAPGGPPGLPSTYPARLGYPGGNGAPGGPPVLPEMMSGVPIAQQPFDMPTSAPSRDFYDTSQSMVPPGLVEDTQIGIGPRPLFGTWDTAQQTPDTSVAGEDITPAAPGGPAPANPEALRDLWSVAGGYGMKPTPPSYDTMAFLDSRGPNKNTALQDWQRDQLAKAMAEREMKPSLMARPDNTDLSQSYPWAGDMPAQAPAVAQEEPLTVGQELVGAALRGGRDAFNWAFGGDSPAQAGGMPPVNPYYRAPAVLPPNQGPELIGAPGGPQSYYAPSTGGLSAFPQVASAADFTARPEMSAPAMGYPGQGILGDPELLGQDFEQGVVTDQHGNPVFKNGSPTLDAYPARMNSPGYMHPTIYTFPDPTPQQQRDYGPLWEQERQSFPPIVKDGSGSNILMGGAGADLMPAGGEPAPLTPGGPGYTTIDPSQLGAGAFTPAAPVYTPPRPAQTPPPTAQPPGYGKGGGYGGGYQGPGSGGSSSYSTMTPAQQTKSYIQSYLGSFGAPPGQYGQYGSPFVPGGFSPPDFNPISGGSVYAINKERGTYIDSNGVERSIF